MNNGVSHTRAGTKCDDEAVARYHVPDRYPSPARACHGDWIPCRAPRRDAERRDYVAKARVGAVEPSPVRSQLRRGRERLVAI